MITAVPGPEQFERWRDTLCEMLPVEVRSPHIADFTGSLEFALLGPITAAFSRNRAVSVTRTRSLIRRGDPEQHILVVNLHAGSMQFQVGRESTVLGRGDMVLVHSSQAQSFDRDPTRVNQSCCYVMIEPGALDLPDSALRGLIGRRLSGRDPVGALVSRHLPALARTGGALTAADGLRLGPGTVDLVTLLLSRHLELATAPAASGNVRYLSIRQFILSCLGDPTLTPQTIALANHLSVRSLHRLFETHASTTVARWILERRLERLHADLADPTLSHLPVAALASRWGFTDASYVSRAFKTAYGLRPTDHRAAHAAY